jgi:transposase-like protein
MYRSAIGPRDIDSLRTLGRTSAASHISGGGLMAKAGRKRKTYTAEQRAQILETAKRENLTAEGVKKKFGVTPVTYYSWRKKVGATRRRGGKHGPIHSRATTGTGDLTSQVRSSVAARVREIIPDIVRTEINHYLDAILGGGGRRRGRRPGRKHGRRAKK